MADEEKKEESEKKNPPILLIAIVILLLFVLIVGGVIAYLLLMAPANNENAELPPPKMLTVPLGGDQGMLINLHGTRVFLRLNAVMEYNAEDEKNQNLGNDLKEKNHILQHEVIKLLRAKSIDDVRPPGSEDKIAEEITEIINKKLEELKVEGRIKRVYFTEYIVQ